MRINFDEMVARRKLQAPQEWKMFAWEVLGKTEDVLVTGGVPTGEYKEIRAWTFSRFS